MSKNKLIPELRFPEFKNEGEWKETYISKIGDTLNGLSGKKGEDFGSGKPYVQYKQVFDKSYIDFSECGKVNIGENENQNILQKGDILFTTSSETPNEVGFASVIIVKPTEPTYLNSFCFILRPFNLKEINPNFSRYLFHSSTYRKSVDTIAQGAIRYNLSKVAFMGIRLSLPIPKEQQKIASCLSSLDEVIAAHSQKLELLKQHKKGLMQNLFPQEGEKMPKIRFKEFENDGEWVLKPVSSLVPQNEKYGIVDGPFGSNLKTIHYKSEGIPIITSGYVTDGFFKADKYLYVTEEKFKEEKRSAVKGGDIIMAKIGARCGACAIMPINHPISILSGNALKITIDKSRFSTIFIWQQLWYLHSNEKLNGLKSIGAQPAISMDSLKKFELIIPSSIEEQKKIASCLNSLDTMIMAQTEKIEHLKLLKKGLMQNLFPKIER